ncbi:MAG: hypothetical protein ABIZ91_02175 [Gemmatimonadaceae bacterium]
MRTLSRSVALLASAVTLTGFAWQANDPRLTNRLDAETREAVSTIIESAKKDGVPTETLVDRALEGASKRARGSVIIAVVKSWADDLRKARQALGPSSPDAEVVAGAHALRNGVQVKELERLRAARSGVRYAMALDVMNYLVNRGVPADTISPVVVNLVLASASDDQFAKLRQDVERDISGGMAAGTAASLRGQGLEQQIAAAGSGNGGAPGSALPSVRGTTRSADPAINPQALGTVQGNSNVSGAGDAPAAPRGKPKPKRP